MKCFNEILTYLPMQPPDDLITPHPHPHPHPTDHMTLRGCIKSPNNSQYDPPNWPKPTICSLFIAKQNSLEESLTLNHQRMP